MKKQKIGLLWFSHDLRLEDNLAVKVAFESNLPLIAIYCFDPSLSNFYICNTQKMSKYRAKFILESLHDLNTQLAKYVIPLKVKKQKVTTVISSLQKNYEIKEIFLTKHWNSEEVTTVNKVRKLLPKTHFKESYTQFLIDPDQLPFSVENLPNVFTSFRKKLEKNWKVKEIVTIPIFTNMLKDFTATPLPSLEDLGYTHFETHIHSAFPFKGGTQSGLKRMQDYFWKTKGLSSYKDTRNGLIGTAYSSKLSAWLACGAVSAKMVYHKIKKYEIEVQKNTSTYWLVFELLWRDYFKYVSLKHRNKIYQINGIFNREINPLNDKKRFENWTNGKTPEPFVNANMQELNQTGFMSNRGRQNTASYLAKTMGINWLWGAMYFEGKLIDYDPDCNYGNWMYVAGTGNDPRDRIFNVRLQAQRYDPSGNYQKLWLNKS